MEHLRGIPAEDGFRMPGEFEPHEGCIMIWPCRPGSWGYDASRARRAFAQVAEAIADSEQVIMLTEKEGLPSAQRMLSSRILVVPMESDDAWARDTGPTFLVNGQGDVAGVDWQFNAWGGSYDGLYQSWGKDQELAERFCQRFGYPLYDARHFVLEGGSIHSDGDGTLLVTEACLLSPGRNPEMTKEEIEGQLKDYLGAEKVIWLPSGIYQDETNEHVDNVCAFARPGEVLLAWTEDREDPQYEMSRRNYEILAAETDHKGRRFLIHKLPVPRKPVRLTENEASALIAEPGEDKRVPGERMAASYVNFYLSNGGVILPQFGDENDRTARELLGSCFPDRRLVPVYARDIIIGGGNIHCITQQIPAGRIRRRFL